MSLRKFGPMLVVLLIVAFSLTVFAPVARADAADGFAWAAELTQETLAASAQARYNCLFENSPMSWCIQVYYSNYHSDATLRAIFRDYFDNGLSWLSTWFWAEPAVDACTTRFGLWDLEASNACVEGVMDSYYHFGVD